jgi:hypothetical protein
VVKRRQLWAEEATKRATRQVKKRRVLEVNIFVVFFRGEERSFGR